MTLALLSLGSNAGDSAGNLSQALEELAKAPGWRLQAVSSLYATDPIGDPRQPGFLNMAAVVEVRIQAVELLAELQKLERGFGRHRSGRWGARELDADLVYFGDLVLRSPDLVIPHPRAAFRPFVLIPLAEIAPRWQDPVIGASIAELARKAGSQGVHWISPPPAQGKAHAATVRDY